MSEPSPSRWEQWLRAGAGVIAPVTVLSTLLFYFGYVSARAQYEYFGVDVDTIGLGTQDYVMRSPQPLLTPLLTFTVLGMGFLAAHTAIRTRLDARRTRRLSLVLRVAGRLLLAAGVAMLVLYPALRDWPWYALVTPALIAAGGIVASYGTHLRGHRGGTVLHRAFTALMLVLAAVSVFWATATVAQWTGRGVALEQARDLGRLPEVVLDTKESLLVCGCVQETKLPPSDGQTFHYRYRHLRLLIHGHDRMFLVPDGWAPGAATMLVPLGDDVRVQFPFQDERP